MRPCPVAPVRRWGPARTPWGAWGGGCGGGCPRWPGQWLRWPPSSCCAWATTPGCPWTLVRSGTRWSGSWPRSRRGACPCSACPRPGGAWCARRPRSVATCRDPTAPTSASTAASTRGSWPPRRHCCPRSCPRWSPRSAMSCWAGGVTRCPRWWPSWGQQGRAGTAPACAWHCWPGPCAARPERWPGTAGTAGTSGTGAASGTTGTAGTWGGVGTLGTSGTTGALGTGRTLGTAGVALGTSGTAGPGRTRGIMGTPGSGVALGTAKGTLGTAGATGTLGIGAALGDTRDCGDTGEKGDPWGRWGHRDNGELGGGLGDTLGTAGGTAPPPHLLWPRLLAAARNWGQKGSIKALEAPPGGGHAHPTTPFLAPPTRGWTTPSGDHALAGSAPQIVPIQAPPIGSLAGGAILEWRPYWNGGHIGMAAILEWQPYWNGSHIGLVAILSWQP